MNQTAARGQNALVEERPLKDLSTSGLLWLINRTVFHPRGFALGLVLGETGTATGWMLLGDGSEPWQFDDASESEKFNAVNATLAEAASVNR